LLPFLHVLQYREICGNKQRFAADSFDLYGNQVHQTDGHGSKHVVPIPVCWKSFGLLARRVVELFNVLGQ
jgi:hypothetical protein